MICGTKLSISYNFEDSDTDGEDEEEEEDCDMSPFPRSFPSFWQRCVLGGPMVPLASPHHNTCHTVLSSLLTHLLPSADNKFFTGSKCVLSAAMALTPGLGFDICWVLGGVHPEIWPPQTEALSSSLPWVVKNMGCGIA